MKVAVKMSSGTKEDIETSEETTVEEFKNVVSGVCQIPADQMRLIFKGHVLKDSQTLGSYGVTEGQMIHLVRSPAPVSTPAAPSPASPAPVSANPLLGQGAARGISDNANLMSVMMQNPMVQEMLDNPEFLRTILNANPQTRAMLERNPEIWQALNDPALLRQQMQAMQNPDLMRELMRNADRTMSNIEAHPEGFNALRRLYQDVQEPLESANPFTPLLNQSTEETSTSTDTHNTPLANPWAPNPQTGTQPANPNVWAPALGSGRLGGFGGLGGFGQSAVPGAATGMGMGMGDLADPMGGMTPEQIAQLMQNPQVQQMTRAMLSDPGFMEQALSANPVARQMIDTNPGLRNLLSDPAMLQALADPNTIQAMLQMQGAMQQRMNTTGGAAPPPLFPAQQQFGMPFPFMNAAAFAAPQGPPEQVYAAQLQQLQDMGFYDPQSNIAALQATGGNVSAAVEYLLQRLN